MLVLTRQKDESVMIGDDVEVVVLDVQRRGFVRLGIIAPREVPVHRKEIHLRIEKERKQNGVEPNMSSETH